MSTLIRINPGEVVVRAFGSVNSAARAVGAHHSQVSRWQSNGRIPAWWHETILRAAWRLDIDLTAHDLVFGR